VAQGSVLAPDRVIDNRMRTGRLQGSIQGRVLDIALVNDFSVMITSFN